MIDPICENCKYWVFGPTPLWNFLDPDLPYCHELQFCLEINYPIHTPSDFGCNRFSYRGDIN